jgi:hypothetical protein
MNHCSATFSASSIGAPPKRVSSAERKAQHLLETTSGPMPQQFSTPFEWAADWIARKGTTLPPDTTEYRSLRNWFNYKLQQRIKKTLGEKNETLLTLHGIDLSQYEALNTGSGQREANGPYIAMLESWKHQYASYDLDTRAEPKLIEWQIRVLKRFEQKGVTRPLSEIQQKLPDLMFGLWRRAGEPPRSQEAVQWWKNAASFERASHLYPAYRGHLHPKLPLEETLWAREQMTAHLQGRIAKARVGWMISVGLVTDVREVERMHQREQARIEARGGEDQIASYGKRDRRLESLLGALLAVRMVWKKASDIDICTELHIPPAVVVQIRKLYASHQKEHKFKNISNAVTDCRMICLEQPDAFSPSFFKQDPSEMPASMNETVRAIGRLAYDITRQFGNSQIE